MCDYILFETIPRHPGWEPRGRSLTHRSVLDRFFVDRALNANNVLNVRKKNLVFEVNTQRINKKNYDRFVIVDRKMNDAFGGFGVVDDGNRRAPVRGMAVLGDTGVVVRPRPMAAVRPAAHSAVGRGYC